MKGITHVSQAKILVVEDDLAQQLIIKKALEGYFDLTIASTYTQAIEFINDDVFDLYLLDIMLVDIEESSSGQVDETGYQICEVIKSQPELRNKPVIFLTSRAEVTSKVLGFQLGADDYIVKPCNPLELRARLESRIARQKEVEENQGELCVGGFSLHSDTQRIEIEHEGVVGEVELTPIEFKLFFFLVKNKDKVLEREAILEHVWGQNTNVMDRSVDTYVAAVRRKLGKHSKCLKSVHGVGYKFVPMDVKNKKAS